jgi:hypothetical protein
VLEGAGSFPVDRVEAPLDLEQRFRFPLEQVAAESIAAHHLEHEPAEVPDAGLLLAAKPSSLQAEAPRLPEVHARH